MLLKIPKYIIENFSDSDRESSDEENSDEKNCDEKNFQKTNITHILKLTYNKLLKNIFL